MKKKKIINLLITFIESLLMSIVSSLILYFVINNVTIAISFFVLVLFYTCFMIYYTKLNRSLIIKYENCLVFIENTIFSFSSTNSLLKSIESNIYILKNFQTESADSLDLMNTILEENPFHVMALFDNIITQQQVNGNNILDTTKFLIDDIKSKKSYIDFQRKSNKKMIINFITLWLMTFLIQIIAKISFNEYYSSFNNIVFMLGILLIWVLFYISLLLLLKKMYSVFFIKDNKR